MTIGAPDPDAVAVGVGEPEPVVYEQGEIASVLTLDEKQTWILLVLLGPYKNADEGDWEFLRAASDVRRRLAEAMGVIA